VTGWDAEQIAVASGARLLRTRTGGPLRTAIDSREVQPGDLFVGLPGEHVDGGAYAEQALQAGAWGVLVAPEHARALAAKGAEVWLESQTKHTHTTEGRVATPGHEPPPPGAVLAHPNPLAGLQALASAWRAALGEEGAKVVGITGSTGKTSTKDILAAILRDAEEELGGPTVASRANLNTEIGLPLTVLGAPAGTKAVVLEMAMRGAGQIAELTAIAKPDVGVIVNVGPVHLQQLGTLEAVAAAKAELIAGMASGTTVVVPAGEPLLAPHVRADQRTVTFGEGADVELAGGARDGEVTIVDHTRGGERLVVRPSFAQSHNLRNLLAATAAARALGVTPQGRLNVELSALRGERIALANGIVLINDCYNANPMSMRAALDDLAAGEGARKVAVLGDMLELGGEERRMHREIGDYARACGVGLLLTVGPLAREMGRGGEEGEAGVACAVSDAAAAAMLLPDLLRAGDVVLVKGSRGMGLELVAQTLQGRASAESGGGA
jgi:UDP-N-acetylmuramoyl-tripeptide--D-alanyl-D-alanine ligase